MRFSANDTLDGVLIEADEDGWHLILSGHEDEYDFHMPTSVALELRGAVRRELDPWVAEGGLAQQAARDDVEAGR
jgi:hypothetical protein